MKNISLILFFFLSLSLQGQYYYNDIIGTAETNKLMKTLLANKVATFNAAGIDRKGVKATDFSEFYEILEKGNALKITTINNFTKSTTYNRFNNQGHVIGITDSSANFLSFTTYDYDANGKIKKIQNKTADPANDFNQTEVHEWNYDAKGTPVKMWRIITSNGTPVLNDSLEIRFKTDEKGNPTEERTFRKGRETGYIYYYYDDNNRLSDIVRYNAKLKKLMPDVMFEYDENDRVIQKVTTTSSLKLGYLIWRNIYDEKGLKTKEALFNDQKQLTGKIDYSYTFNMQ